MRAKQPQSSISPADMTTEQFEDYVTDVRIPALHAQRDQISIELAKLFQSIGFLTDPDWTISKDVIEIHRLLAGPDAPAPAFGMPPAARHHALQVQRNNIDRALDQARVHQAKCIERRQGDVMRAYRDRISKIERARVTTAIALQRINEIREQLREEIREAGGGTVQFATDTAALLDLPRPDDAVDWATRRVIAEKIMTRSEAENAK